jgi:hypothetical protein
VAALGFGETLLDLARRQRQDLEIDAEGASGGSDFVQALRTHRRVGEYRDARNTWRNLPQ